MIPGRAGDDGDVGLVYPATPDFPHRLTV